MTTPTRAKKTKKTAARKPSVVRENSVTIPSRKSTRKAVRAPKRRAATATAKATKVRSKAK